MRSLILSVSPNTNPPPETNSKKSLIDLVRILVEKANLTRGQYLYLILTVLYLFFVLVIGVAPTLVSIVAAVTDASINDITIPIPIKEIFLGLMIWCILGIIYFVAYSIPEIRDRWNTRRKRDT